MVDFEEEAPRSRYHADLLLKVEDVHPDDGSVSGHDIRTGEHFTVSLATAEEMAKHFANGQERQRTFSERLASAAARIEKRPDILFDDSIQPGSVLGLENTRSFTTPEGKKTAAVWPTALARDPMDEGVILGSFRATHRMRDGEGPKAKPIISVDLSIVQTHKAAPLDDFDLPAAFDGEMDGFLMNQTGIVVALRNQKNNSTVSSLETPYRTVAAPSVEAALDKTHGPYSIYAAAVVAAHTGARTFDQLKFTDAVSAQKIESARAVYDAVKAQGGSTDTFEVVVMPAAKSQFIPKKSTERFLKSYFGTRDGRPDDKVLPDPRESYMAKGYVPSIAAMSRHNAEPEVLPASARHLVPENKFTFADITNPVQVKDIAIEALVSLKGETFKAHEPAPAAQTPSQQPDRKGKRSPSYDSAPM